MHLPETLQLAIESLASEIDLKSLKQGREAVSAEYKRGADSHKPFVNRTQLISYLVTRFPATFAACYRVFSEVRARLPHFSCRKMVDLGSGPGSATWAACQVFEELESSVLLERETEAIRIGKKLVAEGELGKPTEWREELLNSSLVVPQVDLAVLSYVVGEMPLDNSLLLIEKLLSIPVLVIIEPGTPRGYERIIALRKKALELGLRVAAPCPHNLPCPLQSGDWCHFAARVERTRLHRQIKGGTLGFEDEKYSFVVLVRPDLDLSPIRGRVIRHPIKGSGHVKLSLCAESGNVEQVTITRSNKEQYRAARDAEWGSFWM